MFHTLLLRDIIEIIFYSSCIFTFCTWLKADKTKNLLLYFLAYCTLTVTAWSLQLPTLTPFLFTYAPVVLLLFIVLHEKTLQRNLVSLCSISPARSIPHDWLDTTLSSCLALINTNKSITIVIEHKDALDYFLTTPFMINADVSKHILDIMLSSTSYDEQKIVWITTNGILRGINGTWIAQQNTHDGALLYTINTDALIICAHPIARMFSVIANGKETKNIAAHQVHTMIKKHLSSSLSSIHKGAYRESSKPEKPLSF